MNTRELVYLTSVTMGLFSQGLESPVIPRPKKPETKYDKKKCKSCAMFHKHGDYRSGCEKFRFRNPWDVACGHYQKRKK